MTETGSFSSYFSDEVMSIVDKFRAIVMSTTNKLKMVPREAEKQHITTVVFTFRGHSSGNGEPVKIKIPLEKFTGTRAQMKRFSADDGRDSTAYVSVLQSRSKIDFKSVWSVVSPHYHYCKACY